MMNVAQQRAALATIVAVGSYLWENGEQHSPVGELFFDNMVENFPGGRPQVEGLLRELEQESDGPAPALQFPRGLAVAADIAREFSLTAGEVYALVGTAAQGHHDEDEQVAGELAVIADLISGVRNTAAFVERGLELKRAVFEDFHSNAGKPIDPIALLQKLFGEGMQVLGPEDFEALGADPLAQLEDELAAEDRGGPVEAFENEGGATGEAA